MALDSTVTDSVSAPAWSWTLISRMSATLRRTPVWIADLNPLSETSTV
jgi:hypothetical protein